MCRIKNAFENDSLGWNDSRHPTSIVLQAEDIVAPLAEPLRAALIEAHSRQTPFLNGGADFVTRGSMTSGAPAHGGDLSDHLRVTAEHIGELYRLAYAGRFGVGLAVAATGGKGAAAVPTDALKRSQRPRCVSRAGRRPRESC